MEKYKVYISGMITWLNPKEYEPLFNAAEANLKAKGYDFADCGKTTGRTPGRVRPEAAQQRGNMADTPKGGYSGTYEV